MNSFFEEPIMKKIITPALILIFLLSACGPSRSTGTPTPAPDDIATQVILLLTQEPIVIPTLPPPPTAEPTQTPTVTLMPSVTEAVGGQEPTATVTSTPDNIGPRATLGDPTWQEKFERDKTSFYLFDDDHTRVTLTNGFLNLTSINTGAWYGWSMSSPKPRNFYLEATFITQTCAELDRYGLVFRAPNYDTGYFFGVTCDGRYSLRAYEQKSEIIPFKEESAILKGANQTNRLGVMAIDDRLELYVNGKLVDEITNSTYTSDGLFGVFIAATNTPGFTVQVDEIAYWLRP